ncbi:SIMPL domain-containing protein [Lacimicrobium sp. SS2-24]|uniref:SIMPL domain-containing protein n=1 Tax=Lacimicrobium sp. SS2-24 TaxID=2005569 RepID=UPI000B4AB36C|nr:SIMPL domain-containing protein [Lacimicrobium sp. SS2-24]
MRVFFTILALLIFSTSVAAQPVSDTTIRVVGQASVSKVPDLFHFNLYIEERGQVIRKLNDSLTDKTERIVASLTEQGVEQRDIASMQVQLQPWYEHRNGMTEQKGFVLSRTVSVSLRALKLYDKVLDAVFKLGATRMDGFEYGFDDPRTLYLGALELAIQDAQQRAEKLAAAAGVKVGKVTSINEMSQYRPAPMMAESMMKVQRGASMPGEQDINARVEVQFELIN